MVGHSFDPNDIREKKGEMQQSATTGNRKRRKGIRPPRVRGDIRCQDSPNSDTGFRGDPCPLKSRDPVSGEMFDIVPEPPVAYSGPSLDRRS